MQIIIACGAMPFGPRTLEFKSLGGSETAALSLGKELSKRGHDVTMFCNLPQSGPDSLGSGTLADDGVRYVDLSQYRPFVGTAPVDLLIVTRDPNLVALPAFARKKVLWMHDIATRTGMGRVLEQMTWTFDEIWTVSEWHRQQVHKTTGYPLDHIKALRNGIVKLDLPPHDGFKNDKQLLYAARPERGLDNLIMPGGIMDKLPEYTLNVCMYDHFPEHMRDYYAKIFERMKQMPNVNFLGPQSQAQLRLLMRESKAYIYPTKFQETSCIIARECIEQGLPVITTRTGALPETLKDCGVYFEDWLQDTGTTEPDPNSIAWIDSFVRFFRDAIDSKVVEDATKEMKGRTDLYWDGVAELVEKYADPAPVTPFTLAWSLIQDGDVIPAKTFIESLPYHLPMVRSLEEEIRTQYPFLLPKDDPNYVSMSQHYDMLYEGKTGTDTSELVWNDQLLGDRATMFARWISDLPPGARILDFGSGPAHIMAALAKRFPDKIFIGIDVSKTIVDFVNTEADKRGFKNMKCYVGDFDNLPNIDFDFDAVIVSEVLEHCIEPWHALEVSEGCSKKGGQVILSVPFGAWEPISYQTPGRWHERAHIWEVDRAMLREMTGPKEGEQIVALVVGQLDDSRAYGNTLYRYLADHNPIKIIDPMKKAMRHIPRNTAAAAVIAMNNEDTILRLLNSLEKKVQAVSIALGPCKDGTEALIKGWFNQRPWMRLILKHVPKIEPRKFGFDDARNASVEGLDKDFDWFLWIDTDEYLSGSPAPFMRENAYDGYMISQHHFTCEPRGMPAEIDRPTRLVRTTAGYRARGHIHEHFEVPAGGPGHCYLLPNVDIGHPGYVDESVRRAKFVRNYPFLEWDNDEPEEKKRPLHKFLWFRDMVHRMRFVMASGGHAQGLALAKEAHNYYNEHWKDMAQFGPGLISSLQYLAEINQVLRRGVPVEITIKFLEENGQARSSVISSSFDDYAQIERVFRHLVEPEMGIRTDGYW